MTVRNLIKVLQRVENPDALVVLSGGGPYGTLFEELGANEPFVVLQSQQVVPGICTCEAYPSGHRHMPDGTLDV
jgi:hypothetical protein